MNALKFLLIFNILFGNVNLYAQSISKQLEFNSANGVAYETNLIINPSAFKNNANRSVTNATATRDTDADDQIDLRASWLVDSSLQNGFFEPTLGEPSSEQTSGNCGFSGIFKGDASLYKAQILDGSNNVLAQTVVLTNETGWREFRVWHPCGASGARKVRITQTESGNGAAINVGRLFYGRMEPGAGVPPNEFAAKVSSTGVISDATGAVTIVGGAPTDTSLFSLTWTGLSAAPTCTVSIVDPAVTSAAPQVKISTAETSTGVTVRTYYTDTANNIAKAAYTFRIKCTKTGADFIQPAITPNTPIAPTVQKFTSGSGTYTTPTGVKYIQVRMVGGGGGGAGSGTAAGTAATAGGNTTFGTSLLVANGGAAGIRNTSGGAGGSASLGTGPVGTALSGGQGQGGTEITTANSVTASGGEGGTSCLGGSGGGGNSGGGGGAASANTGSGGGGGAHANGANGNISGSGGGSGGCIDAIIASPLTSYSYSVGSGGSAGGAGANGAAGGAGGSGYIEVTEYYGTMNVPILLGSVTSNASGADRYVRAIRTTACTVNGACTLTNSTGDITMTRTALGQYAYSWNPAFADVCTPSFQSSEERQYVAAITASSANVVNRNSAGSDVDPAMTAFTCTGPR